MNTTIQSQDGSQHDAGPMIMAYAIGAYFIGVAGLGAIILAMADLLPLGHVLVFTESTAGAISINILLLLAFALQHSIMARPAYKAWSARYLPQSMDRANFVLASGAASLLLVAGWQPLDSRIWVSEGLSQFALWGLFGFGWAYLLAATFAINHFDLFGLRQAWFALHGEEYQPVPFKENWMYRYSRHPIMLGALIGIWCLPAMNGSQLMLAIGMSVYIAIGLYFEERDLVRQWGQHYEAYRQRVGALWTFRRHRAE